MPIEAEDNPKAKRRPKRFRRLIILAAVMTLAVAATLAYRHYTRPERIRLIAENYLQKYVRDFGRLTVESAQFSWLDGVRLSNMRLTEDGYEEKGEWATEGTIAAGTVFSCREVQIALNPLSALRGRLEVKSIIASEPTCSIIRDMSDGTTNLARLLQSIRAFGKAGGPAFAGSLPTIELTSARVSVISREGDVDRQVEELTLTVRGRHAAHDARSYDIVWEGGDEHWASGHSRIDLLSGAVRNVRDGLPWMSIEAVMIAINAQYDHAGTLLDLLGLEGDVRAVDYSLGGGPDTKEPPSATIELKNTALAIPIEAMEEELPLEQRYLRFDQVDGWIRLTATDVYHAAFRGLLHGSECNVAAELRRGAGEQLSFNDVSFKLRMSVERLELPRPDMGAGSAQARFIERWPPLRKFFRDYAPVGSVNLDISVAKESGTDQIAIEKAKLTALGGEATCRWFPYTVGDVTGVIEYTPEGVDLRDLKGSRDGATIQLEGRISKPKRDAEVELHITGTKVRIDDALYEACPEKYRKSIEQFDPRGTLDVDLTLNRPQGRDGEAAKWKSRIAISFQDLAATYDRFPYPLEDLAGRLVLEGERLVVDNVRGKSDDARISVDGTYTIGPEGPAGMDLRVVGEGVPFDDRLLAALPSSAQERVAAFNPSGRFNVETSLTWDKAINKPAHDSTVTLLDTGIRHEVLPIPISDVSGVVHINTERVAAYELAGKYKTAALSASGYSHHSGVPGGAQWTIHCTGLRLDDTVVAALPPGEREMLADLKVEGPIRIETVLGTGEGTGDAEDLVPLETVIHPDGATVHHAALPLPFEDVQGTITLDPGGIRAPELTARYGPAGLTAEFDSRITDQGLVGTINLVAEGLVLDDAMRGLLPEHYREAWGEIRPTGVVDLRLAPLRFGPSAQGGSVEWYVEAECALKDAALPGILELTGLNGTISTSGSLADRLGGVTLTGSASLSTLGLLGRQLTGVNGEWSYVRAVDGRGRLTIDPAHGDVYEGRLKASVGLNFGATSSTYSMSTTATGVQLEPFLNAGRSPRRGEQKHVDAQGLMYARLVLRGELGRPETRSGNGRVAIHEGHMYRLPIMLAILHVINLSIPDEDTFDEAEAEFFVRGDTVGLRDIVLRGKVVALAGHGEYSVPDGAVDLSLAYSNPRGWPALPIIDDVVKELVPLQVTGPLSQPTVRTRPLRGIQEEFQLLFQKRKQSTVEPEEP